VSAVVLKKERGIELDDGCGSLARESLVGRQHITGTIKRGFYLPESIALSSFFRPVL